MKATSSGYDGNYIWGISWYEILSDKLVGSIFNELLDDELIRTALKIPNNLNLVGEIVVTAETKNALSELFNLNIDLDKYEYYVGATSIDKLYNNTSIYSEKRLKSKS